MSLLIAVISVICLSVCMLAIIHTSKFTTFSPNTLDVFVH